MLTKYGILALALVLVWFMLIRSSRGGKPDDRRGGAPVPPPEPLPASLEPCPECGVFRMPGGRCDCKERTTPHV